MLQLWHNFLGEEADEQQDGVADVPWQLPTEGVHKQLSVKYTCALEFGFLYVLLRYLFLCIIAQSHSVYVGYATALGEAAHPRPALWNPKKVKSNVAELKFRSGMVYLCSKMSFSKQKYGTKFQGS